MITRQLTVLNRLGLHARPCALLAKTASLFHASVLLSVGNRCVDAKSILGLMTMAAPSGTVVTVTAEGDDEEQAMASVEELFAGRFGEAE